jgi:hypothetical protein
MEVIRLSKFPEGYEPRSCLIIASWLGSSPSYLRSNTGKGVWRKLRSDCDQTMQEVLKSGMHWLILTT